MGESAPSPNDQEVEMGTSGRDSCGKGSEAGSSSGHIPQQTTDADVTEIESLPAPAVEAEVPAKELPAPVVEATVPKESPAPAAMAEAAPAIEEPAAEPAEEAANEEVPREVTPVIVTEAAADEPKTPPTVPSGDERPKSPWTLSYSITHQGNSPLASPACVAKEIEDLEQLPPAVEEKPSIVIEESADPEPETAVAEAAQEPPARPWTPSYSVTRQGSASDSGAEDDVSVGIKKVEEAASEAPVTNGNSFDYHDFPSSEEPKRVSAKPSLERLAVVDENVQIQIDKASPVPAEVSPSSARARHKSTTSSRFFPGGWFSSMTKLPDERRTSLEHAGGEFSKNASADSLTPEVPLNTPIDGNVDDKKKQKWCVIM
ncbi:hypothetical protein C8T65DRAFT_744303 [Cerioporus squamosus]|nr:hypothetical protein C8T65DRAFT_744303 [Cerioporus squamosus]